jgi:beta-lactamase superfamily II metal-dependent hydrolase
MTFTWHGEGSSYWPGRLDYIVYSGSVLDVGNSFVAFTPGMSPDTLSAYGLESDDAVRASDHIPVVADFALPVSVAELGIHCLDVGHGDCTLIVSPTGGTMLIDAGADGIGDEVVVPYLESLGLTALDYVIASNYNPEHIGGVDEVVEHLGIDSVRVAVLDRGWSGSGDIYDAYEAGVGERRSAITDGQVIDLGGGVTVRCVGVNGNGVLAPPFDEGYEEADLGVALVIDHLGFDFFVAGDLPGVTASGHNDIESSIAGEIGDIDVYRVSNHGGAASSGENLVSALLPEAAVISVGADGPGGFPVKDVLDRLTGYGCYIYQTGPGSGAGIPDGMGEVVGGNIVIRVTAQEYSIEGTLYEVEQDGITISALRAEDANGESVLLGQRVRLRGIVTAGTGVYSGSNTDIFVQDATGGVNVFKQAALEPEVAEGDKIEVEGFVDHMAGLTRITSPEIRIRASGVNMPEPVVLTTEQVAAGAADYEGSMVRLEEVHIAGGTWPAVGSDGAVLVDDGSGACRLFVDEDAGLPTASEIPDTFDVTGILGQYDATFPFISGYRIMPRSRLDIVPSYENGGALTNRLVAATLPNPARRQVRIRFLRSAADYDKSVSFYDVRGRRVGRIEARRGTIALDWNAEDTSGRALASGIYFAVVEAGGLEETVKLVIMR